MIKNDQARKILDFIKTGTTVTEGKYLLIDMPVPGVLNIKVKVFKKDKIKVLVFLFHID